MSLIIAVVGGKEAIIGGDKRSITFLGDCSKLEEELYSGRLSSDEEMQKRAKDLSASLLVSDEREKVWHYGDILVGEVTEISPEIEKRRRIYLVPGAFIMADITGKDVKVIGQGNNECIVLGNKFTQRLAVQAINKANGKIDNNMMSSIFLDIRKRTPTISQKYCILSTKVQNSNPKEAVFRALQEDCKKSEWRICAQQ
jgi:hypothetical protein